MHTHTSLFGIYKEAVPKNHNLFKYYYTTFFKLCNTIFETFERVKVRIKRNKLDIISSFLFTTDFVALSTGKLYKN